MGRQFQWLSFLIATVGTIMSRVKNRAPAAVQITAEQLLFEAKEARDPIVREPTQRIRVENLEELDEYQSRKRAEYEERVRRSKSNM
ncbi:hypothetical protein NMY22_g16378 [Coprinellus aureogranulatus]|nr:hypothetical protein NMY22_g16378 [Coprinellus aureogranulatus]